MKDLKQKLDSQEFYELMQEYRNENIIFQQRVLNHFEAVKTFILDSITTRPAPISEDTIGKLVSIALRYDLKHQGLYDYEQHLVCEILKILPMPPETKGNQDISKD